MRWYCEELEILILMTEMVLPLITQDFVEAPLVRIVDGPWVATGFAVVMKVNGASGKVGEIWIIFNLQPEDEDGNRYPGNSF